jgi:hypothetical protein
MSSFTPVNPVDLTAALVRCPSVTPADAGAGQVEFSGGGLPRIDEPRIGSV